MISASGENVKAKITHHLTALFHRSGDISRFHDLFTFKEVLEFLRYEIQAEEETEQSE